MARSVSSTFRQAINSQNSGEAILILLELNSDDIAAPIRVVNNTEAITSNGEQYLAFPFHITLPNDSDEGNTQVQLTIDNIDRQIVQAVRVSSSIITATMSVILASAPDTVELGPFDFSLKNVSYNSKVVTATLEFEDILNAKFPSETFVPSQYPGLF